MQTAIIGCSLKLPKCHSLSEFETLLFSGKDAFEETGSSRVEDNWVGRAGCIRGHNEFDYSLFGLSLRDSYIIDPQQRMFLQNSWLALENAGYSPKNMSERVGVYSVSSDTDYAHELKGSNFPLDMYDPFELELGSNKEQQSLRTSYLLNLRGPSMGVQSACSSGLLSIHVALQGLELGDCEVALAGGSCLPYPLHEGYFYREGMNWSKSGKISSFDESADGMVAGFGTIVWVLKPLEAAISAKDNILAVIKGSSINNDGFSKSSYTAPSTMAISENLSEVMHRSGIAPEDIDFIEAHGSGTKIGDVIEAAAIKNFYSKHGVEKPVPVSSIKSVIGHLDTVAGHAGVLKAVAQLKAQSVAPAANFNSLNKSIRFSNEGPYVPTNKEERVLANGLVNSLGIGGTNCALIVSTIDSPVNDANEGHPETVGVVIGAETPARLQRYALQLRQELLISDYRLIDIAFTLNRRSKGKPCIYKIDCASVKDLCEKLKVINEPDIQTGGGSVNVETGRAIPLFSSEVDLQVVVDPFANDVQGKTGSTAQSHQNDEEKAVVRDTLETIWIENLMVSAVSDDSSFEGMGGHSMMALTVLDEIKERLDITLPLDWISDNDRFIEQVNELEKINLSSSNEIEYVRWLGRADQPRFNVVCIHASLSGVEKYTELYSHLNGSYHKIAIDSHNLYSDKDHFIRSVEELSEIYSQSLLDSDVDLSLPTVIGGWSLGGMIANSMIQKLKERMNIVASFAIDSVLFAPEYRSLFLDENLQYFLDVDNFIGTSGSSHSSSKRRLSELFEIERKMAVEFSPIEYTEPMLNVVATVPKYVIRDESVARDFDASKITNGWPDSPNVTTVKIPANHESIMTGVDAASLAEVFDGFIRENV